ncbi:hypothetical protein L1885_01210 [Streptomyces fuscigenes]|nr:hypothetical protein [Streptomyces fuscigenes]
MSAPVGDTGTSFLKSLGLNVARPTGVPVSAPAPPVATPDPVMYQRAHVPPATAAPAAPAPSAPAPAGGPAPAAPATAHHPGVPVLGEPTKSGLIRAAVKADPSISLDDLTDQVRDAFGDKKDLRKDVGRLRRRIEKEAS